MLYLSAREIISLNNNMIFKVLQKRQIKESFRDNSRLTLVVQRPAWKAGSTTIELSHVTLVLKPSLLTMPNIQYYTQPPSALIHFTRKKLTNETVMPCLFIGRQRPPMAAALSEAHEILTGISEISNLIS